MTNSTTIPDFDVNRFWSKVAFTANDEKCWNWTASRSKRGYGKFSINNKDFHAHRVSYFITNKELTVGKVVMHSCDNPSCVNPKHLVLGTYQDNSKDMSHKKRGKNQFENGEKHPNSKLKESDVVMIKEHHSSGQYKQSELAIMFAVHPCVISRIINRKRWQHH